MLNATKYGNIDAVKAATVSSYGTANMTNKITSTFSYQRIFLTLILCLAIAVFFQIYLNPPVLQHPYAFDFGNRMWPGLAGNKSYGNETSVQKGVIGRLNNTYKGYSNVSIKNIYLATNATKKAAVQNYRTDVRGKTITSRRFIPEDLMKKGPFRFLSDYKNPCWKAGKNNKTGAPIRCLPYFYLIGAPKSGTTDMYNRLIQHPEISKLVEKEPHWLPRKHYYDRRESTFADYLKYFTRATIEIKKKNDSKGYHRKVFGDCSACTMWDNDYWTTIPEYKNRSEPLYTNADYIHHLNPNTKIIAMLRNPIDRLYSDYLYFRHGNPEKFHTGVEKAIRDAHECLKKNTLRHCAYTPPKHLFSTRVRLRIGFYHLHLKEYWRVFPRDQVMVIKLEEFSNKTTSYMQKIFEFLDLTKLNENDLKRIAYPEQHANIRRKKDRKVGDMLPKTRKLLEDFYRPHNEILTELLGEEFDYNRISS